MGLLIDPLVAGKERHQRVPLVDERQQDVRLADQQPPGHAGDALERRQRVAQMVEHAEQQDQIELAEAVGVEVVDVEALVLDARP